MTEIPSKRLVADYDRLQHWLSDPQLYIAVPFLQDMQDEAIPAMISARQLCCGKGRKTALPYIDEFFARCSLAKANGSEWLDQLRAYVEKTHGARPAPLVLFYRSVTDPGTRPNRLEL